MAVLRRREARSISTVSALTSVPELAIDGVDQGPTREEALEVLEPAVEQAVDVTRRIARNVRRYDHVAGGPPRRIRRERFLVEHVEHRAYQFAAFELLAQAAVIDERRAADVVDTGAALQEIEPPC